MEYTPEEQEAVVEAERKLVSRTHEIFRKYSNSAEPWRTTVQTNRNFRMGRQWTEKQIKEMEARGQAPVVVNRVYPAVESAKAMLTANRPSFRAAPREDSDNQLAQAVSNMMSYIYDISDGAREMRQVVDDYYVAGMGAALVFQDPLADMGKGEVKFVALDPLNVYIDPNSKLPDCSDAEHIIYSTLFSREQAERLYPMYADKIKNASSDQDWNFPAAQQTGGTEVYFESDVSRPSDSEFIRGYEWYTKKFIPLFRTYEEFSGKEALHEHGKYEEYLRQPAAIWGERVLWQPEDIAAAKQQVAQAVLSREENIAMLAEQTRLAKEEVRVSQQEQTQALASAVEAGEITPERAQLESDKLEMAVVQQYEQIAGMEQQQLQQLVEIPSVIDVTFADLVEMRQIRVVKIMQQRVRMIVVIGDQYLYQRTLPTEHYPLILFPNHHTRTPYPTSDVAIIRDLQLSLNKLRSLILAHAATSTNVKVLVPIGAADIKKLEAEWARPGALIEIDFELGQPVVVAPVPLSNELYRMEAETKSDIDHQLGLYEMMMGNSQNAPQTYKATISLDEFGQRKIKSKLMDIEGGLKRMGEVIIDLMQQLYVTEKYVRILQPNNSMTEFAVNERMYDDYSNVTGVMNDITVGRYDVSVVAGSTLPSNRYAQLELYIGAYEKGIIDQVEVLDKTEVFDKEGVLQRMGRIQQLERALEEQTEKNKQLNGDMQTKDREIQNLRNKVEVEKFTTKLKGTEARAGAASELFRARLDDTLRSIREDAKNNNADTPVKGSAKGAK